MAVRCHHHHYQMHRSSVQAFVGMQRPRASSRVTARKATVSRKQAQPVIDELLQLVAGTDRGLNTPEQVQESILAAVEQLRSAQAGKQTTDAALLSATWKVGEQLFQQLSSHKHLTSTLTVCCGPQQ